MSILTQALEISIASDQVQINETTGDFVRANRSHVKGETNSPLLHLTIPELLEATVSKFGAHDAILVPNSQISISYYQFYQRVDELAAGFLAIGLSKGDRIGIWSTNRLEWILTQFATARIGSILVNINPAYRKYELRYALQKVGCKALILEDQFKTSNFVEMLAQVVPELESSEPGRLNSAELPELKSVILISDNSHSGTYSFSDLTHLAQPTHRLQIDAITRTLSPHDPINLQFTSGTTGAPKGATLTHFNIINNAHFVTDRIELSKWDKLCIPVPFYHCFGMFMGTLGCVTKGACMVIPGHVFNAVETLQAIEKTRSTAVYGVPTMFIAMLETMDQTKFDVRSLRTGIMAGAPCPSAVMQRVIDNMNMRQVTICYGMTETSPVSFQSFVDDPIEKRVATVGRIHPHLEVKMIDSEGKTVAVGEQGELCTRGYSVMRGYWNDEQQTTQSIVDGWMHTGDLASLDQEGFCYINGRVKDMIIRGGENIYPREIEEFLYRHPDVKEVQVFGVPDVRFGEVVCAWVIAQDGANLSEVQLREFCDGQIAHFKIPQYFRIVDEIPMTVTGKPQKFKMREMMIEQLEADT